MKAFFLAESAGNGLKDATSKPGSSAEHKEANENSRLATFYLESSEDDPLFKREKIRRPFKTYKAITPTYNPIEIYVNSDESSNDGENIQHMEQRQSVCIDFFNRYRNFAIEFRNSKFIYIVQILSTLLPISAIVMGKNYAEDCPGSPNLTGLTLLTGIWTLFLIGMWIGIKCCHPEDRPCEGQQKLLILCLFISVVALLEIEIYQFSKVSPKVDPSASNYCMKVFYDYTYYKFIAAFGSMLFVVLLYFPGCSNFASGLSCAGGGRCYDSMMDEDN
ncbi:unnamed protein product [Larinioides sclopetarius]|uniref:Uncharacterized protein n=1 Tax=Larinioides sclopetarius TaxID=280406 RepID=A0AAV2BY53_9ARAC